MPSRRGWVAGAKGRCLLRLGHPAVLPHLHPRAACDRKLDTCLFAAAGRDLRALLRTGATDRQLIEALAGIWAGRADRYSQQRASNTPSHPDTRQRIEMSYIGG